MGLRILKESFLHFDSMLETRSSTRLVHEATEKELNGLTSSLNHNYIPRVLYKLCALNAEEILFASVGSCEKKKKKKRDFPGCFL